MDIGLLFKLGGLWSKFSKSHPKFPQFVKAIQKDGITPDTVIDVKITYPDGKVLDTNLKITESDMALMEELKKMKK